MSTPLPPESIEILLVEDSPGDARLTQEAFKEGRISNRMHLVCDGVEAMAFLRREGKYAEKPQPDLVLLDLNMPRKDGREVLAEIKTDDALKHIPVIVLTTSDAEADILKSYGLHANCYLVKPVECDSFFDLVRTMENFWMTLVKLPGASLRKSAA